MITMTKNIPQYTVPRLSEFMKQSKNEIYYVWGFLSSRKYNIYGYEFPGKPSGNEGNPFYQYAIFKVQMQGSTIKLKVCTESEYRLVTI